MRCISIVRSLYVRVFSASFLITLCSCYYYYYNKSGSVPRIGRYQHNHSKNYCDHHPQYQHVISPYDSDKRKHFYASLRSAIMVDIAVAKHEMYIKTSGKGTKCERKPDGCMLWALNRS